METKEGIKLVDHKAYLIGREDWGNGKYMLLYLYPLEVLIGDVRKCFSVGLDLAEGMCSPEENLQSYIDRLEDEPMFVEGFEEKQSIKFVRVLEGVKCLLLGNIYETQTSRGKFPPLGFGWDDINDDELGLKRKLIFKDMDKEGNYGVDKLISVVKEG